jgi:hypothetical protein
LQQSGSRDSHRRYIGDAMTGQAQNEPLASQCCPITSAPT